MTPPLMLIPERRRLHMEATSRATQDINISARRPPQIFCFLNEMSQRLSSISFFLPWHCVIHWWDKHWPSKKRVWNATNLSEFTWRKMYRHLEKTPVGGNQNCLGTLNVIIWSEDGKDQEHEWHHIEHLSSTMTHKICSHVCWPTCLSCRSNLCHLTGLCCNNTAHYSQGRRARAQRCRFNAYNNNGVDCDIMALKLPGICKCSRTSLF